MPSNNLRAVPKVVSHFVVTNNRKSKKSAQATTDVSLEDRRRQSPPPSPQQQQRHSTIHKKLSFIADRFSFANNSKNYSDRLKVFVGTWNMYGRLLPIDLSAFLTVNNQQSNNQQTANTNSFGLDGSTTHPYHLLVIGTQECERDISESLFYPSKEVWEKRLSDYLGTEYRLVKTETLAALHVAVFVWFPVVHMVKDVQSESIKTGWANMVGNKGAVAVSILFGTRSILFINCHLRAHQTKLQERNANVQRILYELKMPEFKSRKSKKKPYLSVIDQFDHVFLFGDTNYRINAERPFVFDSIKQGKYNALLEHDQLSIERRTEGSPLGLFQEHPIQFPPTYKLDTNMIRTDSSPSPGSSTESTSAIVPPFYPITNEPMFLSSSTTSLNKISSQSSSTTASLPVLSHTPSLPKIKTTVKKTIQNTKVKPVNSIRRRLSSKRKILQPQPDNKNGTGQKDNNDEAVMMELELKNDTKIALFNSPTNLVLTYDSSEKQRVPSWTDRILWCDQASAYHIAPPQFDQKLHKRKSTRKQVSLKKQNTNTTVAAAGGGSSLFPFVGKNYRRQQQFMRDTVCYSYDAVLHESLLGVSDHMPVIGVFGIWFDDWNACGGSSSILSQKTKKIIGLPLKKSPVLTSSPSSTSATKTKKNKKLANKKSFFSCF